jgi:prepilin-type N-terminal cleavage/methylation domain-containing protein
VIPVGSRRGGMTLIEVLLATMILGLSFVALLTALARCLAVIRVAKNFQEAHYVLGTAAVEFPLLRSRVEEVDDPGEWEVSSETYDNGFTYTRTVDDPDLDGDDDFRLVRITETVSWETMGKTKSEVVESFKFFREP